MSSPLRTAGDYEFFLYTLTEQFPSIQHSTATSQRVKFTEYTPTS